MKLNRETMTRVETELRRTGPSTVPPDDLHDSIVQAVRRAGREADAESTRPTWRWAIAPAMLGLVAAWVWMEGPRGATEAPAWTAAGVVLERAHAVPQQASAVALAPLVAELEFVDRDVRRAVDVLLASVP